MLIDDITITVQAGHGGKGAVAFNKNMMSLGPAGGTGGTGGSIYFEAVSDIGALNQFRYRKDLKAEDGQEGRPQFSDGSDGKDLVIEVPVGTMVENTVTGAVQELVQVGERALIAKGGNGGKGNFHFRSPKNTSPRRFQEGLAGEYATLRLQLKLIADAGFIGFPNVGKSSLLNELTNAKSKVANYPFTTLDPSLGAYYELILADIPGLIEGASGGKGLGVKFLRHIERTTTLFHCVSAESADVAADYDTIRKELGSYNPALLEKDEYVFLTKSDRMPAETQKKQIAALKKVYKTQHGKLPPGIFPVSIYDWESLEKVKKILNKIKDRKLGKKK